MDFHNRPQLHATAAERLKKAPEAAAKIAVIYGGLVVLASLLSTVVSYFLGTQINNYGGLGNMGIRSALTTVRSILPMALNLLLMAVELGFLNAMLRIGRGQFASPNSLRMGFDRFWPLLKVVLLQSGLYLLAGMASFYIAMQIFTFTPAMKEISDILMPLISGPVTADPATLMADPALAAQMVHAMIPLFVIMAVVMLALSIPIFYFYRMVNYIVIDKPGMPAMWIMRESRKMMRHNCLPMFRLDLSMWWYYLAMILASVVCYGDAILPLLGVELPISPMVSYFLFLLLYLAASFAIICFLRPHVEVTYALAYESLKPKEQPTQGAVLGNIFNM